MESKETIRGIVESTTDWEAGNADTPVARHDYSRTSPPAPATPAHEDEANSDLGNLGRDVQAEPVGAGEGR